MFVKVRRTFTVLSVLFLLGLFLLPSLYLRDRCAALNGLCDAVLTDARSGDGPAAREAYGTLTEAYEAMRRKAELFMDHQVMDDATVPLVLMGVYLDAEDVVSLEAAAAEFRQALSCMLAIETGDIRLLL